MMLELPPRLSLVLLKSMTVMFFSLPLARADRQIR